MTYFKIIMKWWNLASVILQHAQRKKNMEKHTHNIEKFEYIYGYI